jgi:DNA-binding transcriptional LysR family regulator
MARPYLDTGRLVARKVERPTRAGGMSYAWRAGTAGPGRALQWWLAQLDSETTRDALLFRHRNA